MTLPATDEARDQSGRSPEHALLSIEDLKVDFATRGSRLSAVRGLSLRIGRGQRVGIVGESGSGKSVTAHAILRLIPNMQFSGRMMFEGKDLLAIKEPELRTIRGNRISMIFQDPLSSLDPMRTIGSQIVEAAEHGGLSRQESRSRGVELLTELGVKDASRRFDWHPHQFSGGMRQRVMIAIALISDPDLLIADEPTTALDVRIQARLLDLLWELSGARRLAVLLISHDLAVVGGFCDRVAVMYAGRIVEEADSADLFRRASHPYTLALLESSLTMETTSRSRPLTPIPGSPPSPLTDPPGCSFAPRCRFAQERCWSERPQLRVLEGAPDRTVACHFAEAVAAGGNEHPGT
jgi:oligopeptide/dipeptide ABC transporter ATP-binding protein